MNDKQLAFCREYVKDWNATQAAIRAGYSAKTAKQMGSENLSKPDLRQEIAELTEMKPEEVKSRLADIARGDLADLMAISSTGWTVDLMITDPDTGERKINPKTKLIKRIRQRVTTVLAKNKDGEDKEIIDTEIELYPADQALIQIGKIHGLFVEKTEISGPDGGAIPVEHFGGALEKAYGGNKPAGT